MKLTIESTGVVVTLDGGHVARAWAGTTEGGHACTVYVSAVGVSREADAEFEAAFRAGVVAVRSDPRPEAVSGESLKLSEDLESIRQAVVELARSHEREAHGGEVCGYRRSLVAGCLAHCLGVKGSLVFAMIERMNLAERACRGGCGHEDTVGTESAARCGG